MMCPSLFALLALACTNASPLPTGPADEDGDGDGAIVADDVVSILGYEVHEEYGSLLTVRWKQDVPGTAHLRYRTDPEIWRTSPRLDLEAGEHEQILAGLPYDWEVEVKLVVQAEDETYRSHTTTLHTDRAPAEMPRPSMEGRRPPLVDQDSPYVLLSMNQPGEWDSPWWSVIIDRAGRAVWARPSDPDTSTLFAKVSANGDSLLIDQSTFWTVFDYGKQSEVVEVLLDGTELSRRPTPGLHHSFVDLPDGTLLWGAHHEVEEYIRELSPDGTQRTIWTCDPETGDGNCGSNAIYWSAERDSIFFSLQGLHSIVEVSRETGEELRWFGAIDGAYGFDPPESQFWKQHGVQITDSGTLLLSTWDREEGEQLLIREYTIDDEQELLVEDWSYTEDLFAYILGDVARLEGGNTLHSLGHAAHMREVTPDGVIAWDVAWDPESDVGRATPIDDIYALLPD